MSKHQLWDAEIRNPDKLKCYRYDEHGNGTQKDINTHRTYSAAEGLACKTQIETIKYSGDKEEKMTGSIVTISSNDNITQKELIKHQADDARENIPGSDSVAISKNNRQCIKQICQQVLTVPRMNDNIDVYVRFVKGMVLIHLENPFEKIIEQRIQAALNKTVKPILKRLEFLEKKVAAYEKNVLKVATNDNELTNTFDLIANELMHEVECTCHPIDPVDVRVCLADSDTVKDTSLIIPNRSLDEDYREGKFVIESNDERKQMIVRITSWICRPIFMPDELLYNVDLTKRSIDLLVEERTLTED